VKSCGSGAVGTVRTMQLVFPFWLHIREDESSDENA
jgi:hypothetical protein